MMNHMPQNNVAGKVTVSTPVGLYILSAGVLVGILLGPFVLGRFAPQQYATWFPAGDAADKLAAYEIEAQERIANAKIMEETTGVTSDFIESIIAQENAQLADLRAALHPARAELQAPMRTALLLAIIVIMGLESALTEPGSKSRSRLSIARYALASLLIALLLSCPWPLSVMSMMFFGLALLVALVAAFVPMGRRA